MDKDTVCISLEEYNRLKDIEAKNSDSVKKAHTVWVESGWGWSVKIETDKEAVSKLANKYKDVKQRLGELETKYANGQLKKRKLGFFDRLFKTQEILLP